MYAVAWLVDYGTNASILISWARSLYLTWAWYVVYACVLCIFICVESVSKTATITTTHITDIYAFGQWASYSNTSHLKIRKKKKIPKTIRKERHKSKNETDDNRCTEIEPYEIFLQYMGKHTCTHTNTHTHIRIRLEWSWIVWLFLFKFLGWMRLFRYVFLFYFLLVDYFRLYTSGWVGEKGDELSIWWTVLHAWHKQREWWIEEKTQPRKLEQTH